MEKELHELTNQLKITNNLIAYSIYKAEQEKYPEFDNLFTESTFVNLCKILKGEEKLEDWR